MVAYLPGAPSPKLTLSLPCLQVQVEPDGEGPIARLPEELLLHILSLLPIEDLVCRAARVCTDWRRLAFDDTLWASAELHYTKDSQVRYEPAFQIWSSEPNFYQWKQLAPAAPG